MSMQLIFDVIQYFSNLVSRNNFGDKAEQAHRERERERERPLNSQSLNLNSPFWLLSRCLQIIPRNLVLRQPNTPFIVFLTHYNLTFVCLFSVMFFTASHGTDRENLFKNLELHELKIISFIPLTVTFDSGVIWYGEIR